jgi:hypothetical protein
MAVPILNLPAHWKWVSNAKLRAIRPDSHCTGGWVGLGAGLDGYGHYRFTAGFEPRTVQPVASRYTS